MRIPDIQARLREKAAEHGDSEIATLADELSRRPSSGRAPRRSRPMTPALAAQIRQFKKLHPDMGHDAIGRQFNVNQGRVSEALKGKRT